MHGGPQMRPIAKPSRPQHYVLPCSELLDPPYSWWSSPTWPYPRAPWAYETESRAPGTGLLWGPSSACPPKRCPPCSCRRVYRCTAKHWWGSYFPKHRCC